ncbi:YkoP family protein [Calidifontibacillus oryziterrae]|uniref:YkoP family protein n=1 Tax=Calidifontibacillus oryziterrae TaxID=1191699 RepID=UPI0002D31361|nr:hypothetical protein [Calidifontibacillus oryziterrae]
MREYLLTIWGIFDPIYFKFTRLCYVSERGEADNIFRVRLTRYKGKPVVLSDGTKINKNDTLVKIHLHNVRLLSELITVKSEIKKAKVIYEYVKQSLPKIEQYVRNHKHENEIKGIIGITLLNRGAERLGFEVFSISNPIYKVLKYSAFLPICFLFGSKPSLGKHSIPSYLFMSKEKLSKLYKV